MAKPNIVTLSTPTDMAEAAPILAPLMAAINGNAANMALGAAGGVVQPRGVVSLNTTPAANTATNAINTIMTYALPANALDQVGRTLSVKSWGKFAGNAQNKQVSLQIGGQTYNTGSSTQSGTSWVVEALVTKTGANAQSVFFENRGILTGGTLPITGPSNATDTSVDTSTININVQVTDGSASGTDVTVNGLLVEYMN